MLLVARIWERCALVLQNMLVMPGMTKDTIEGPSYYYAYAIFISKAACRHYEYVTKIQWVWAYCSWLSTREFGTDPEYWSRVFAWQENKAKVYGTYGCDFMIKRRFIYCGRNGWLSFLEQSKSVHCNSVFCKAQNGITYKYIRATRHI